MNPEKLKEITKAANDAVAGLDTELKAMAFQTILSKLLAEGDDGRGDRGTRKAKGRVTTSGKGGAPRKQGPVSDDTTKKLLAGINRSKHHAMHDLTNAKDKALYVLQIAKDEQGVDGLTPPQMSKILDQIFRVKATPAAISMTLMKELKMVDRKPSPNSSGGKAFSYRIMHAGEQHLKEVLANVGKKK